MLKALNIRNFALVAELDIEFGPGLTVVTGESGAGKSILLDALSMVLGARVKRSQLRPGASACDVSAEFDVAESAAARTQLQDLAMARVDDDTTCLVRRTAAEGRSRAFVNGVPVTLEILRSLTEPLIDIHGQHEHRQLLIRDVQRRLLDDFGVDADLVVAVRDAFRFRARLRGELDAQRKAVAEARERKSLLGYQIDEIEALGDALNRVAEITALHKRLSRAREWTEVTDNAIETLDGHLVDHAARLASTLDGIDDDHPRLKDAVELTLSAQAHLEEALSELRRYRDALPDDGSRLADVDTVLAGIHDVARKHRVQAADLGEHLQALKAEFAGLWGAEERIDELARSSAEADAQYLARGAALSEARSRAAGPFSERVEAVVAKLGLPDAEFGVRFEAAETADGLEAVEFRMTTNPRYPSGRLSEFASGGELSRFALAIEVVAAESSKLPCLVLDEADIGVGGTTADVVGRLLLQLARSTQVIAITHAPQVAALGTTHLLVSKTGAQDTVIETLDDAQRTEELARMLGGRTVTDKSRNYAKALLADGESR